MGTWGHFIKIKNENAGGNMRARALCTDYWVLSRSFVISRDPQLFLHTSGKIK